MTEAGKKSGADEAIEQRLLNDEDFVQLMEAEYKRETSAKDEISKQRVWKRLEAEVGLGVKPHRRSPLLPLAVAAVLVLTLMPLFWIDMHNPEDEISVGVEERIKGGESFTATPELRVFAMSQDGQLKLSKGSHEVGSTVVFKLRGENKHLIALLLSKKGESPSVRYRGKLNQGHVFSLLQNAQNTYGYMFDPDDTDLRFCAVSAADAHELQLSIQRAKKRWQFLPKSSCVQLSVKAPVR